MFFLPLCLCTFFCSVVRSCSRIVHVLGSLYEVRCHEKVFRAAMGTIALLISFFRMINEIRCLSYFQFKRVELKLALKERYFTHGSLMNSAVRQHHPFYQTETFRRSRCFQVHAIVHPHGNVFLYKKAHACGFAFRDEACFLCLKCPRSLGRAYQRMDEALRA